MVQLVHLQEAERHFSMWRFEVEFVAPPQSHEIPPCCCNAWGEKPKLSFHLSLGNTHCRLGGVSFTERQAERITAPTISINWIDDIAAYV